MRIVLSVCALASAAALAGCSEPKTSTATEKPVAAAPAAVVDGVHPDAFDCKAFLSEAEVAGAAGAEVKWQPADMPGTPGTPSACVYVSAVQPELPPDAAPRKGGPDAGLVASKGIQAWQYHLDCRPVAVGDAKAIMASMKPQEGSVELAIGRGAIDHTNARVIAVDDDTDCAAYVVGPDAATREALARLVVAKLARANMPKSPRAR